ncbi:transposase-like protein [Paenibacillus harenae]|nr:transposase-like protein [Paenibacillus harenae]
MRFRFVECMIEGFSLRKCAEQLNDEVTHVTLFYWRHKILSALKQIPTEADGAYANLYNMQLTI